MSFTIPANIPPPSDSGSDSASDDGGCSDWDSTLGDALRTQALFEDTVYPTAQEALAADAARGFDLQAVSARLGLDLYARMRLINWIRRDKPAPAAAAGIAKDDPRLADDALLRPVLADDPLLQLEFDEDWSDDDEAAPAPAPGQGGAEVKALRAEIAALRGLLGRTLAEGDAAEQTRGKKRDDDTHYFDSYAENDIHEIMLKDTTRTVSYAKFILSNPAVFKDAVVLDVGAGTGILSMFAARAGAKHVYAIEASGLATKTRENIAANGLQGQITVIQAKVEDCVLPPGVDTVDVIISEWMGYMLLYESMLDSVLVARDRFLAPGGLMAPSQTRLVISGSAATRLQKERITFWQDVYGFEMSSAMTTPYYGEGLVEVVDKEEVVTSDCIVRDINTHTATVAQLEFNSAFSLLATSGATETVRAFLTHFDTFFSPIAGEAGHVPPTQNVHIHEFAEDLHAHPVEPVNSADANLVSFTTGPRGQPTHWKQVSFLLREPFELKPGQTVDGRFYCKKANCNSRELEIEIHYAVCDQGQKPETYKVQAFKVQ